MNNDLDELVNNLLVVNNQSDRNHSLNIIEMGKGNDIKCRHIYNTVIIINSDCKIDSNISTACDSNNDTDISLVYNTDNDCDTDDDCDAESEKTQSFLY